MTRKALAGSMTMRWPSEPEAMIASGAIPPPARMRAVWLSPRTVKKPAA